MFGLGVLVGQGSSPVLFETRSFQERLGRMVSELSAKMPEKEKVDLKFYDVLEEPVCHPVSGSGEITPGPETGKLALTRPTPNKSQAEGIPVKRSRKLATWHQTGQARGNDAARVSPAKKSATVKAETKAGKKRTVTQLAPKVLKSKTQTGKKTSAVPKETRTDDNRKAPVPAHGAYTIQIASYKKLNDALTQMVFLNKKGITSYRASVKINGDTWYRVRTGAFADYKAAMARLAQLADSGVNGMVIKKEQK